METFVSRTRELNIIIFGQTDVEKCVLANILTSGNNKRSRLFPDGSVSNRHIGVRYLRPSIMENTRLKLVIVPQRDCKKYYELLETIKKYDNRFIFYVLNSTKIQEYNSLEEVNNLKRNIGDPETRYIPVVYRDTEHLGQSVTEEEKTFLQAFPDTHCHAPLIDKAFDQVFKQQMMFQYLQYAYERQGPGSFKIYRYDQQVLDYLCLESEISRESTPANTIFGSIYSRTPDEISPTYLSESKIDADKQTEAIPLRKINDDKQTEAIPLRKINDDDYALYNHALDKGLTKSHHVRIMVVGPNGAGKTTLIKRLNMEYPCCSTVRSPTEGIDIEKSTIRCRVVNNTLEWEAQNADNDFKRNLDVQKVAKAMENIEEYGDSTYPHVTNGSPSTENSDPHSNDFDGSRVLVYNESATSNNIDKDSSQNEDDEPADYYSDGTETEDEYMKTIDKNAIVEERILQEAIRRKENARTPWTYCSFWDFAGHAAYDSTHQLFLSSSVIYLLVVDLSKELDSQIQHLPDTEGLGMFQMTEAESLKFWLGSIQQHVYSSDTRICLVATHEDQIVDSYTVDNKLAKVFEELQVELPYFVLDNTQTDCDQDDIQNLKRFIESSAYELADENVPANWIKIEEWLDREKRNGTCIIHLKKMIEHFGGLDFSEENILSFLHYQHSRGGLHFFLDGRANLRKEDTDNSNDNDKQAIIDLNTPIFIDPMILVQFVNLILKRRLRKTFKIGLRIQMFNVSYSPEAVLDDEYISEMLRLSENEALLEYKDEIISQLMALHILFTFRTENKEFMFMPCLLRQQPKDDILNRFHRASEHTSTLVIKFATNHICQIIFHQLVAALHVHYNPMKKIESNVEISQVYCGYVSFNLSRSGLQQMQMYWKPHGIYLRISNMSTRTSLDEMLHHDDLTLCQKVLDTTLDCLNEVISTCRNSPDYELMVICPEHFRPPTMVPFDILVEENACICPCECPHELTKESALKFWISPRCITQSPVTPSILRKEFPTDKQLARLALSINVNTHVLAYVLKLANADMEAVWITFTHQNNKEMQILECLLKWKQENGDTATFELLRKRLEKIIKRREGDWISRTVLEVVKTGTYGLEPDVLQAIPSDRDLFYCIGLNILPTKSCFLFLELGIAYATIEQIREQKRDDFKGVVHALLRKWKEENCDRATFQTLLDTISFVGGDTTIMVEKIKIHHRRPEVT